MSMDFNFLLFLLLICIVKVFDVFSLFNNIEGWKCSRSQNRSIDTHTEGKARASLKISSLQPELNYVIQDITNKEYENVMQSIQNEYMKHKVIDTYDSLYDNVYQRVQIDNDSLVKAGKNEVLDRFEIVLNDTSLSNLPDYKE